MKKNHLILGGTFDHFHVGHELFLRSALEAASGRLTIGITTLPLYANKPLSQTIETYAEREKNVKKFLAKINKNGLKVEIIPIKTIYGTSLTDVTIDGIVVTPETEPGAYAINRRREEAVMKPLEVITVPLVLGTDGQPVSSFRIRYGDIDRNGLSYYKFLVSTKIISLPEALRPQLRRPIGDVYHGSLTDPLPVVNSILSTIKEFTPPMTYTIGDIIYINMAEAGYRASVAVIDHKSRREALSPDISPRSGPSPLARYRNRAGTIEDEAVIGLYRLRDRYWETKTPQLLEIEGEEDLLALPAILSAPLDSFVLYGQRDEGVVLVRVTEKKKKEVVELLAGFTRQKDD